MTGPRIEEFFLGEPNLEAYYTEYPCSAMALQPDLPTATKRSRELEAHGYYVRPPRGGSRPCFALQHFDGIDEISVSATMRGVRQKATPEEVAAVKESYRASEFGDAWWIAWDCRMHPYMVMAILRHLSSRGELPPRG